RQCDARHSAVAPSESTEKVHTTTGVKRTRGHSRDDDQRHETTDPHGRGQQQHTEQNGLQRVGHLSLLPSVCRIPSHGQTSPTCDAPAFHTRRFPCARCQVRHAPGRFRERLQPFHGQRCTGLRECTTHHSEV